MPDYNFTLTLAANTKREDAEFTDLNLTKGILAGGHIFFPAGCHGLAHVTIHSGTGQLYPANKDDTFHGEDGKVELVGRHELDSAPYKLLALAWNLDDTYDHTVQIKLNVLSVEEVNLSPLMRQMIRVLDAVKSLLTGRRIA